MITCIYETPQLTSYSMTKDENIPLKIRNRTSMLLPRLLLFNIVLDVLAKAIRKGKRKAFKLGRILSIHRRHNTICKKSQSTQKKYQKKYINSAKSQEKRSTHKVYCIPAMNTKRKSCKTIPLTVESKRIKYIVVNLIKKTEKYKHQKPVKMTKHC